MLYIIYMQCEIKIKIKMKMRTKNEKRKKKRNVQNGSFTCSPHDQKELCFLNGGAQREFIYKKFPQSIHLFYIYIWIYRSSLHRLLPNFDMKICATFQCKHKTWISCLIFENRIYDLNEEEEQLPLFELNFYV